MDYCTCEFCQWYWLDGYCVFHGRCVKSDHCCDHFVKDENEVNKDGN